MLGAGLSGVSAAFWIKKLDPNLSVLLIERRDVCGGAFDPFSKF
jgi:protoporphyrinogen oxidase